MFVHPDMTEKLLTGMLKVIRTKENTLYFIGSVSSAHAEQVL